MTISRPRKPTFFSMIKSRTWAALLMSEMHNAGGFCPGKNIDGVFDPPTFPDATDVLIEQSPSQLPAGSKGVLLLADGTKFEGRLFGAEQIAQGELVFTTGMCGYQESLTDPSFAGQVLTFTYPLLGNYGISQGLSESSSVHPRGVVCRQHIDSPDHRDSIGSVHDFLLAHKIPGIEGIDTRSLTKRVREHGTLLCVFGPTERISDMEELLSNMTSPDLEDLVAQVTCEDAILINQGAQDEYGDVLPRLAVIDCGIKFNILRELSKRFEVVWCPATLSFEEIQDVWGPDAFFASNGPGDPAHSGAAKVALRTLSKAVKSGAPVMGICLGHQLMGLAAGLRTYKLRYGHRGSNQPVLDLISGKVSITSQNHGFAVEDPVKGLLSMHPSGACSESGKNILGSDFRVRHINSNDGTVEGLDLVGKPAFTVQFHPEASPGPHDASELFDRFQTMVSENINDEKTHLRSRSPT